ncbi:MAG: glycosyltransferase [Burkholderiales bacterium]|nr:glycosyltransferase [Burkholderiales bacterium]
MSRATAARPLLLCLSHLRWKGVWQRPQHLMSRASQSFDVVFVEEPLMHDRGTNWLRMERVLDNVTVATPYLSNDLGLAKINAVQRYFLKTLMASRDNDSVVTWYYTPMALPLTDGIEAQTVVYDCMDELSCFRNAPPQLAAREQDLLAMADLVFTGGRSLFEAKRALHDRVHCFPSSVDVEHFLPARGAGPEADDQAHLPRPRIGYYAVIDERFDTGFLRDVARLKPDWTFVMIGPLAKITETELPRERNIHWTGMRAYRDLPAYLRGWDAALMPFAINDATRFISPTKTPEFLAAGLPVVSTPVRDVVADYGGTGLVDIARTPAEAVARLEAAMARDRTAWLAAVDRRLARMSWGTTWSQMESLIKARLGRSTVAQRLPIASEPAHV